MNFVEVISCCECLSFWSIISFSFLFLQHFTPLLHLCPQLSSLLMFVLTLQVIPKTFSDNLKKNLPQSATLKGPSGLTWDVELTTNDDATFFNHGWQKFVMLV